MTNREDLDFTLQTLLEDRIVLGDCRWYFDHGRIFSGRGGNVGLTTSEQFAHTTKDLVAKWGRFVGTSRPGFMKGQRQSTSPMSIRVERQSALCKPG
jgi:hypothetical protein